MSCLPGRLIGIVISSRSVEDEGQSKRVSLDSKHPIDLEPRQIMRAALHQESELERLLDLRATP